MRSLRGLAATTVILSVTWGCGGGDGGGVGPNNDPVANFTVPSPCTVNTACAFTDASTDPEGNNTITGRRWTFGDGSPEVTDQVNPSHTYVMANTYQVTLTVTDNGGKSNARTIPVTVAPVTPNNVPPTASFVVPPCTSGTACTFTSTSSDTDGNIMTTHWDFGDGTVIDGIQVPHTYNVTTATPFSVILTVTDDDGAVGTITQTVNVSPAAAQQCLSAGPGLVNCGLDITAASTVTITLTSVNCEFGGDRIFIEGPPAARQSVFFNVCAQAPGIQRVLRDNTGLPLVFQPGERVLVQFKQGTPDPGDPVPVEPQVQFTGSFPDWVLNIDDGGNPSPGFDNNVVLSIHATRQ